VGIGLLWRLRTAWAFAVLVAVLSYGAFWSYRLGSGFEPEISDVTTSIYYTTITLSTVGYGDFSPVTPETRWFVLSLIVVGMSIFATVIVSTLGPAIRGQLAQIFNPAVNLMKPSNHVILVGEGLVARTTAQELARADMVFASAAVGSRLLANLVEGNEIPTEFQDLLEGQPEK
jgi:voltage-gated potassium channel